LKFTWFGGIVLGTFLIFFMLALMGTCWWAGISYDTIYRGVRDCRELGTEIERSRSERTDGPEKRLQLAEMEKQWLSCAERTNHRMCETISGRMIARIFNFSRIKIPGNRIT
jgi:hypothetical protein